MKIDTKSAVIGVGVIAGIALVGKGIHMFFTRKKGEFMKKKTVIILHEKRVVREALGAFFKKHGFRVLLDFSLEDALKRIHKAETLVLVDTSQRGSDLVDQAENLARFKGWEGNVLYLKGIDQKALDAVYSHIKNQLAELEMSVG